MMFRLLQSDAERQEYGENVRRRLKVDFGDEYLRRSQVYGLFDAHGVMVGGTLYCAVGPFRSLQGLPDARRTEVEAQFGNDIAEATGLWLDRKVLSPAVCASFYARVWWSSLRTKKRYSVFSFSLKIATLRVLYEEVFDRDVLYEGTVFCEGMREPDVERVCLVHNKLTLLRLLFSPVLYPRWFMRRVLGRVVRLRRKPKPAHAST